ncbi:hypothetical protein B1R32_12322 [Abditibacterium utsteinense]|uniref:Uncharacterized protein n=1 Tax=Abditibacterium utsteinense TaxID=1960156 RepID=A0A2S8SPL0_9BACT|nr:hypothetical protein [Abditibacterium utsteinense]PQV62737.1 hypothetical protein B1R32_12322 [Abditibacterium utsteinense]
MTSFPGEFWLKNWRIEIQSVWFSLFGIALLLSIGALHRSRRGGIAFVARGFWALSMGFFFAMWIAGAALEMMRRTAPVSGSHLVLALAAFSLLLAATLSLAREGFGATWNETLRPEKMALALLVLTLAGWFFGGMSLESNALWNIFPPIFAPLGADTPRAPDGWNLSLGGAALWGISTLLQSHDETTLRVKNPRAAMWFLLGVALLLALPQGAHSPAAASVFSFGAGIFAFKVWRVRADCPRFLRSNWRLRGPLLLLLSFAPFFVAQQKFALNLELLKPELWATRLNETWRVPSHFLAFAVLLAAIFWLLFRARQPLRITIFHQFPQRSLLSGALGGFCMAAFLFGPTGAIFWAFWPLAGVFFDLLTPRESLSRTDLAGELHAGELARRSAAP